MYGHHRRHNTTIASTTAPRAVDKYVLHLSYQTVKHSFMVVLVHFPSRGGGIRGSWGANYPPPPPRGLWPTVSCQRCRPQASIGAKGARCYMNTKGALRKILSNLHPNTI